MFPVVPEYLSSDQKISVGMVHLLVALVFAIRVLSVAGMVVFCRNRTICKFQQKLANTRIWIALSSPVLVWTICANLSFPVGMFSIVSCVGSVMMLVSVCGLVLIWRHHDVFDDPKMLHYLFEIGQGLVFLAYFMGV